MVKAKEKTININSFKLMIIDRANEIKSDYYKLEKEIYNDKNNLFSQQINFLNRPSNMFLDLIKISIPIFITTLAIGKETFENISITIIRILFGILIIISILTITGIQIYLKRMLNNYQNNITTKNIRKLEHLEEKINDFKSTMHDIT